MKYLPFNALKPQIIITDLDNNGRYHTDKPAVYCVYTAIKIFNSLAYSLHFEMITVFLNSQYYKESNYELLALHLHFTYSIQYNLIVYAQQVAFRII